MIDAGVIQYEAKQMTGHRTDSMFVRYDIVNPERLKRNGDKTSKLLGESES